MNQFVTARITHTPPDARVLSVMHVVVGNGGVDTADPDAVVVLGAVASVVPNVIVTDDVLGWRQVGEIAACEI